MHLYRKIVIQICAIAERWNMYISRKHEQIADKAFSVDDVNFNIKCISCVRSQGLAVGCI